MDADRLRADLVRDEAVRLKPYRDSVGKLSIGVGRNLDDKGISEQEAMMLLGNDITEHLALLDKYLPWWAMLDEARQLYRSGSSLAQVGERFGVDAATVWRTFRRLGVQMRNPWERS